jgi:hypothetical protein
MARCDADFSAGVADLLYIMGDSVSYAAVGGSAVTVSIVVGAERVEERNETDGIKRRHVRDCSIPVASVAVVTIGDAFTFGGESYIVDRVISKDASAVDVEAVRLGVAEKTRDGFRRRN